MPKQAKHEEQLNEMHDALYQLGEAARSKGGNLLPASMNKPTAKAKKHINRLHKAFKKEK
jgi:methylmalonyl-CoA mutase N-terminal domain/subunit